MRNPLVWLRRIRHRCGYGIHSPLVFGLVTQVVYNDGTYYAYQTLRRRHHLRFDRLKTARLLFRLANDTAPDLIVVPPSLPEPERDYIHEGCRKAEIQPTGDDGVITLSRNGQPLLTIVLDLRRRQTLLETLKADPAVTVTFDLYTLALAYHNLPTNRQHHIINF
ncbi:MAG: hypothetical protein HUK01_04075 [Bacteroidaceae bacterium]|nr:hypothetical protein [Bacteroidaceae bacterium]